MLKEFTVTLDISKHKNNPVYTFSTNDWQSLIFLVTVQKDGVSVDLTGITPRIAIKKTDKTTILQDGTVTDATNGKCEFLLTSQAYVVSGTYKAEVMLYKGTEQVATTSGFTYMVSIGVMNIKLESKDDWPTLSKAIEAGENEPSRITAEETRIANENDRITSEEIRQTNEESRQIALTNMGTATENATTQALYAQAQGDYAKAEADRVAGMDVSVLTTQLAQKATQIANNSSAINSNTIAISNIGNSSPKGVYSTLLALQTAFPTGTTGIYVVTADGKWYFWNGSAWTPGGTYQSAGILNGSITIEQTAFLKANRTNFFDNIKAAAGELNVTNGTISASGSSMVSDFIPITEGLTYTSNNNWNYVYYNSSKAFVSGATGFFNTKTVPTGQDIKYIRIGFGNANLNTTMFVQGSTLPSPYVPYTTYTVQITDDNYKNAIKDVVSQTTFSPDNTTFLQTKHTNFVDTTKAVTGVLSDTNGTISASSSSMVSDYLPVTEGKTYTANSNWNYVYYNSSKQFVSGATGFFNTKTVPTGQDIKYIRIGFGNANLNTTMFVEGSLLPDTYVSYSDSIITITDPRFSKVVSKATNLSGLKWNVLGDSITYGLNATKPYWYYVADDFGLTVNNYGISGSTVGDYGGATDPMVNRYSQMADDADIITVLGGTNDCGSMSVLGTMSDRVTNTFYGALHTLFNGLITKYPNKRIGVITPLQRGSGDQYLQNFVDAEIQVANYYAIPVLDLYRSGVLTKNVPSVFATQMDAQLLHPNNTGHSVLARRISNFIRSL